MGINLFFLKTIKSILANPNIWITILYLIFSHSSTFAASNSSDSACLKVASNISAEILKQRGLYVIEYELKGYDGNFYPAQRVVGSSNPELDRKIKFVTESMRIDLVYSEAYLSSVSSQASGAHDKNVGVIIGNRVLEGLLSDDKLIQSTFRHEIGHAKFNRLREIGVFGLFDIQLRVTIKDRALSGAKYRENSYGNYLSFEEFSQYSLDISYALRVIKNTDSEQEKLDAIVYLDNKLKFFSSFIYDLSTYLEEIQSKPDEFKFSLRQVDGEETSEVVATHDIGAEMSFVVNKALVDQYKKTGDSNILKKAFAERVAPVKIPDFKEAKLLVERLRKDTISILNSSNLHIQSLLDDIFSGTNTVDTVKATQQDFSEPKNFSIAVKALRQWVSSLDNR